ncbi:MAG TPA: thiamine pyrophosphate-binding protein, partial [Limnochordales bacterium]
VGSGNYRLVDAMVREGIAYYGVRHEANAVGMASGYERVSGRLAACTVHQGPGFTNTLTSLADAVRARSPLLLLAAAAESTALYHNQRIDQAGLAALVGAAVEQLRDRTVGEDLARAVHRAKVERRPVVLSLPTDWQERELPEPGGPPRLPWSGRPTWVPAAPQIEQAVELICASSRPVVLAGRGAVRGEAPRALRRLGDCIGALFVSSAPAKGVFDGSPYDLGVAGGLAPREAAALVGEADLILAFGASLNFWTTRRRRLFSPQARVVHVDDDPRGMGLQLPVDLALVGDVAATALALAEELERRGYRSGGFRQWLSLQHRELTAGSGHAFAAPAPLQGSTPGTVDPRGLAEWLDRVLPPERTVVVDAGHFMAFPVLHMRAPAGGFVPVWDFQAVGIGLGVAMGAAVGCRQRLTVLAVGDGGLWMNLGDLETVARYRIPLLVVVFDDAAFGAEVHHFRHEGVRLDFARFPDRDLAQLARAVGGQGHTVRQPEDLESSPLRRWLANPEGLFLLDCKVDPSVQAEFLQEAFLPE